MKLVIAIVNDEDALDLLDELTDKEFRVTKLASTGGFLRSGNTTMMIGVENEKVQEVLTIIEETCKTRHQIVSNPSPLSTTTGVYVPYPVDIEVGGATVFVVDVENFVRV
ncbi:cyclic-di-AMP receptor [Proteiniclasticum sp. QWL-01]|uniref:cyclic-di-AMP receptor n=1 Tax=Proteiniclasticum sp. QWL-01 TaxID=3036945 RepID=UPI002202F022|nr:cyclic-di-AMP receptor [Proteiniclasticum sp. QWL-01]UUM11725.1 cyclic-di-AMP receptor [Clostridiaceae bacterium HFYG-1003]WFF73208.1 cyclic-di-AMP receptor [Proteiniclasticum sp. QWL-01]